MRDPYTAEHVEHILLDQCFFRISRGKRSYNMETRHIHALIDLDHKGVVDDLSDVIDDRVEWNSCCIHAQ